MGYTCRYVLIYQYITRGRGWGTHVDMYSYISTSQGVEGGVLIYVRMSIHHRGRGWGTHTYVNTSQG